MDGEWVKERGGDRADGDHAKAGAGVAIARQLGEGGWDIWDAGYERGWMAATGVRLGEAWMTWIEEIEAALDEQAGSTGEAGREK